MANNGEKQGFERRSDRPSSGRPSPSRNSIVDKNDHGPGKIVPEFTGSAAGSGIDRHENPLFQVPIDSSGAVSFGNWPYPGKGLYGLGYNFKPLAAVVMPTLLIAGLALLYPGVVNAARYGRKKRSVDQAGYQGEIP
jgi:hypothetical protein